MSSNELPPFTSTEFIQTQSPNPGWTFGQSIDATPAGREWAAGEATGWTVVDTAAEDNARKLYGIFVSGLVPRPVAFVSSISEDGVENLAPFSWFNQVAPNPPLLSFSCLTSSQQEKDTSRNIKATKGFTVNIISEPWVEQANAASIDAPRGVSEWPITGLTRTPSIHVKAPRVKESAFSMECELYQALDIPHPTAGGTATVLVIGRVLAIHMRNDVVDPTRGTVLPDKLRAIGRLGGVTYARVTGGFALTRPAWKDLTEEEKALARGE